MMNDLNRFLQDKIMDCEEVFANANTDTNSVFMEGMLKHGGELNALLMAIGKRQAFNEVIDYLKKEEME